MSANHHRRYKVKMIGDSFSRSMYRHEIGNIIDGKYVENLSASFSDSFDVVDDKGNKRRFVINYDHSGNLVINDVVLVDVKDFRNLWDVNTQHIGVVGIQPNGECVELIVDIDVGEVDREIVDLLNWDLHMIGLAYQDSFDVSAMLNEDWVRIG